MYKTQDIQLPDIDLRDEYIDDYNAGNVTLSRDVYTNNLSQLEGKVLIADIFNTINDKLEELQDYYSDEYILDLQNKLNTYQNNVDNTIYLNEYNDLTSYNSGNLVFYTDNNLYYCYQDTTAGTIPTNTSYWLLLGLRGEKGDLANGTIYKGEFVLSTSYVQYDMVKDDNKLYVAKSATQNNDVTNTTYWQLAFTLGDKSVITVSDTEPIIDEDDIWFNTSV